MYIHLNTLTFSPEEPAEGISVKIFSFEEYKELMEEYEGSAIDAYKEVLGDHWFHCDSEMSQNLDFITFLTEFVRLARVEKKIKSICGDTEQITTPPGEVLYIYDNGFIGFKCSTLDFFIGMYLKFQKWESMSEEDQKLAFKELDEMEAAARAEGTKEDNNTDDLPFE